MKKRLFRKRVIVSVFLIGVLLANMITPLIADALRIIKDSVTRDDIAAQLEDAAYMNAVVRTLQKCINGDKVRRLNDSDDWRRGLYVKTGDIFSTNNGVFQTEYSVPLKIEDAIQENGGDDGAIWCVQGTDDGNNIFQIFMKLMKKAGLTANEVLCNGHEDGIVHRVSGGGWCDSFSDDNADSSSWCIVDTCYYWTGASKSNQIAHLQRVYEKFLTMVDNPYMPSWDEIGKYNNVDGYFLYIMDFNFFCDADKVKKGDNGAQPVVIIDRQDKKIEFTRKYYYVLTSKTWQNPISSQNPVTSCTGFLDRIEDLRKQSNEVTTRAGGYQGIVTAELKNACKNAKTEDGQNAWTLAKTKLEDILAAPDTGDDLRNDAQSTLNELNNIISSDNYVKIEGNIETEDSMVIQCYEPEAFNIDVAAYEQIVDPDTDFAGSGTSSGTASANCYSRSGALGWILCPIIDSGANFVVDIYERFIEPFLVLDSGLFDTNQAGGIATREAWSQFQMYANLLFVVGFLVVIFSQLTGVGIDNYGIKKILPKLIVGAILINLSYLVCQLAIDVANIIGYGMKSIFDGISVINMENVSLMEAPSGAEGVVKNGVVASSILVALVGLLTVPVILAEGPAILIPIFLAIIGIVIAIFSLFCILSLRKAMAVVLVVISPLAFMCYMLPNTKKLFDKWLTFFKAILLSFPICSAMVYGGQAASRIIVAAAGTSNIPSLLALSAAIMAIAPVFLIPGVIKKSMGSIGSVISGLSHKMAGGAKMRAMKYSRGLNYLRQRGSDHMAARQGEFNNRRAASTLRRMNDRMRDKNQTLGDLKPTQRRKYMSATGMTAMHENEMQKAYSMSFQNMAPGDIANAFTSMIKKVNDNPGKNKFDKNLASAAIQKLSDANQHDVLNTMLSNMDDDFVKNNIEDADRMALGTQLSGLKGSNVVAGLYGKSLAKGGSSGMSTYLSGAFNDDIKNAGKNIIASQDDSTLGFMADHGAKFDDDQMRNSIGSLDTKQQNAVNRMWSGMKEDDVKRILSGMSTEQYAKVDTDLATAIGGGVVRDDHGNIDSVATGINIENGRNIINSATLSQRQALMSDDGAQIRASQTASQQAINDWTQASAEEIKRVLESVHGGNTWDKLSPEDKSTYFHDNPQEAGESNDKYMQRILNQHAAAVAEAVKNAGYRNGPAAPTAEPTPAPTS